MVEGGARVLASFLESQLVDFVVVTISPMILGGLPAVHFKNSLKSTDSKKDIPRLDKMNTGFAGEDLVVFGRPRWIVES
jgi:riboflavin biosynthesis pyrimidine reductase